MLGFDDIRRSVAEVFALVPGLDLERQEEIRALGARPVEISLDRVSILPWRECLDFILLVQTLVRIRPDAIFAYFVKPVIYGALAARLARVPKCYCLIEGAGYAFGEIGVPVPLKRRLLRWLVCKLYRFSLERVDRLFVLNSDDEALFVRSKMVRSEKLMRLPGIGIDLVHYSVAPIVEWPITFLLMGRLRVDKGVRDYVTAARKVRRRYPDTRFLLLGKLDLHAGGLSESEVRSWVAEGLIEWPGHVKDVRPWISQASVLVLPSFYREGRPRSILEAMSMGRPIITTNAVGCRETVVPGENGLLVPTHDPNALSEAMTRFIQAPELVRRMGRASRDMAERQYDVHSVNATIMQVMDLQMYS